MALNVFVVPDKNRACPKICLEDPEAFFDLP
jgi:hypothetical protein